MDLPGAVSLEISRKKLVRDCPRAVLQLLQFQHGLFYNYSTSVLLTIRLRTRAK
jgi:hypothetical protein